MPEPKVIWSTVLGFRVCLDKTLGHLMVEHDGTITWDQLQAIKNAVWGEDARAIEVYPAESQLVNVAIMRHLWRLGPHEFAPDLLGSDPVEDDLQTRYAASWAEARL